MPIEHKVMQLKYARNFQERQHLRGRKKKDQKILRMEERL